MRHADSECRACRRVAGRTQLLLAGALWTIVGATLLLFGLYAGLAGAYLVAVPLALYWWMGQRWTRMGKIERTAVYGLVFLFFPGLILFAPFLNFRLQGQGESAA